MWKECCSTVETVLQSLVWTQSSPCLFTVIPFTIHNTHWHSHGNNNTRRPQFQKWIFHACRWRRCDPCTHILRHWRVSLPMCCMCQTPFLCRPKFAYFLPKTRSKRLCNIFFVGSFSRSYTSLCLYYIVSIHKRTEQATHSQLSSETLSTKRRALFCALYFLLRTFTVYERLADATLFYPT